jgi:hypothetical protein
MLTDRSEKLPIISRQAMIIVTEAKGHEAVGETRFLKPSLIRYPSLFMNPIAVITIHSVAEYASLIDCDNTL